MNDIHEEQILDQELIQNFLLEVRNMYLLARAEHLFEFHNWNPTFWTELRRDLVSHRTYLEDVLDRNFPEILSRHVECLQGSRHPVLRVRRVGGVHVGGGCVRAGLPGTTGAGLLGRPG